MSTPPRETNIDELKLLTARDKTTSDELAARISQLRIDMTCGTSPSFKTLDLMEQSNKDITRKLILEMDAIDAKAGDKDATDRQMLQALNARVNVRDSLSMRLAELRDLQLIVRSSKLKPFGYTAEKMPDETPMDHVEYVVPEHEVHDEEKISDRSDHGEGVNHSESGRSGSVYFQEEEMEEPEVDKSTWPLLYQMLDVDPDTSHADIVAVLNRARKRLAPKHCPQNLPNDMSAFDRWEKVNKAFNILIDPEKRRYYDSYGNIPSGLGDIDVVTLEQIPKDT